MKRLTAIFASQNEINRNSIMQTKFCQLCQSCAKSKAIFCAILWTGDISAGRCSQLYTATQKKCLCDWHTLLFSHQNTWSSKITVGAYRKTQMQVIFGCYGNPKIHFETPAPKDVQKHMQAFFQWWKRTQNSINGLSGLVSALDGRLT